MKKILPFVLLFLCFKNIYAEEFFKEGDISQNQYFDTLGYGIDNLLESRECPNCVEYDINQVYGTKSRNILSSVDIGELTEVDQSYGLIRKSGVYDRIALPPYSSLDFIYWSKNVEQENVNISSLKVFLSRQELYMGDLQQVLYIEGEYENFLVKYKGYNFLRSGITKTYPGMGIVLSGGGVINGVILDSVYVRPGLEFLKWEAQIEDGEALIRIYVVNVSNKLLNNVVFKHEEYTNVRNFNPYEEYVYEYTLEVGETTNLGYAGIYDPNSIEECVVIGQDMGSNGIGDSAIVGGVRESNSMYQQYISSRVKPEIESFCVTRIPYTLYSGEMKLKVEEEEVQSENISEQEIQQEDMGSVLGIKKLPQTSSNTLCFLVVFPILWYYLLRRFLI